VRTLELILLLLAVAGALQMLARRIEVPYPSLLVIGGLALAFIPGLPRIDRDPELLFFIFIPPLLYWTAVTTSLRELKSTFGAVARLATLLVLATMAVVAVVAHLFAPRLGWAAAFLLGAIVAPPDPVAATAVIRPLGVSEDVTTLLEGEGLFNDATALVAYRVALTAVITGTFSAGSAALHLFAGGIGGAAIGLVVGVVIAFVRRRFLGQFPILENVLSLIAPFIAYIPADMVGTSGVIAVATAGLYLIRTDPQVMSPASRIQAEAMWTMLTFVLESVIFILIGLELRPVVHGLQGYALPRLLLLTGLVTLACIAVRFAWVFGSVALLRSLRRRRAERVEPGWNSATVVAWAGMRGADSLIIALAIPLTTHAGTTHPVREVIIFVTFGVILATLVVQGVTLAPLVRRIGPSADTREERNEEATARIARSEAALRELDALHAKHAISPELESMLRTRHRARIERWREYAAGRKPSPTTEAESEDPAIADDEYGRVSAGLLQAEHDALDRLRENERVSDDILRQMQREIDLEALVLESRDPTDEPGGWSPYEGPGL
jgi:CPA1 family monovalent cation:H+ antiporter